MPTGTWDRLPADRRKSILAAAEAEFAANGFGQGSLNTICKEAGVSKGSLFQYFTDKADMCVYVAELASKRIQSAMETEIGKRNWGEDFFGSLDSLIETWIRYFYEHPPERALTAAVNLEPNPESRVPVRATVNHHYLAFLRPLVEEAVSNGTLRADSDVEALLSLLLLTLPHIALAPHVEGLDPVLHMTEGGPDDAVASAQRLVSALLHPYRA